MKITLRDLLWLTMVVGLATAWWLDHRSHSKAATEYAATKQHASKLFNALHVSGVAYKSDPNSGKVTVYEVPKRLRDAKYDAKIAKRQLEMLEAHLVKEGRTVEWIWADGEVSLRIKE